MDKYYAKRNNRKEEEKMADLILLGIGFILFTIVACIFVN